MLGGQGYEVRAVTNGRQALQAVEREPPDLVLLDISMPEMDGYEVCRRLKAQERSKDVPVIFLTALTDTVDKVRAFDAGGVDYVTKPFQIEEVLARVKTHVALRRARVGLAESYTRLRSRRAAPRRSGPHGRPRPAIAARGAPHQSPSPGIGRDAQRRRAGKTCSRRSSRPKRSNE